MIELTVERLSISSHFFPQNKVFSKTSKTIEKIHMDSEKSIHSFKMEKKDR